MISAQNRFYGHGSIRAVYRSGQSVRGQNLSLKYLANPRRKTYRLAVVVSKKVHKSAVMRNRIRRRIYEIVRKHQADITKPFDIICTVYSDQVASMPHDELETVVVAQLRQAKILA